MRFPHKAIATPLVLASVALLGQLAQAQPPTPIRFPESLTIQGKPFRVYWGPMPDYFNLLRLQVGMKKKQLITGIYEFPTLTLLVEGKTSTVLPPMLYARYYNADGVEVGMLSIVGFNPPMMELQPGVRYYADVTLPTNMSSVAVIVFTQL